MSDRPLWIERAEKRGIDAIAQWFIENGTDRHVGSLTHDELRRVYREAVLPLMEELAAQMPGRL